MYQSWLDTLNCSSFQELYSVVECIAKDRLGIDPLPFPLSALENPGDNEMCQVIIPILL